MSKNNFIHLIVIIIITGNLFSCNGKEEEPKLKTISSENGVEKKDTSSLAKTLEIYCWCFKYPSIEIDSITKIGKTYAFCETPNNIRPEYLIKEQYQYSKIVDNDAIKRVSNIIFQKKNATVNKIAEIDVRFVLLFRETNDTLSLINDSTLYYNRKNIFYYNFNILDSVKDILHLKKIDCMEK